MKECSWSTEVKSTVIKSNNISFSSFMKYNYWLTLSKDFKNVQKYCKTSTLSKKSPISISTCDKRIKTYIQESFNNISKWDNISGNQDQLSTIYNTLNSYLNKNKLSIQSGSDEIKKLRENITSIIKNQSKLLISIDQEIAINIASLHIILNDYIINSNKNNNTITQDSNTNTNNSSTIVNCWSRTALGVSNDTAENCMNKQFKTCAPAIITNFSLDPEQNPFEAWEKTYYKSIFEIIWYKDNACLVKFTSLTSQVSQWNNKSMTCNFDKSKTFVENINSYYLNKCSGELYNIMSSK
jgi:hypothetical protein